MKTLGLLLLGLASACSQEPPTPAITAQPAAHAELSADALFDLARGNDDAILVLGDWYLSAEESRVELEVRGATNGNYRLSFLIQTEGKTEQRTGTARVSDGALRLDAPVELGARSIAVLYPLHILTEDALVPDVFLSEYQAGHVRRGDSKLAFKREFRGVWGAFSGPDDLGY